MVDYKLNYTFKFSRVLKPYDLLIFLLFFINVIKISYF